MLSILSRLIVAAGLIFAATTAAQADPISILILGFLSIAPTTFAVGVTTFLLSAAASVGLSYLAKALAPKPSQPDISSLPGGTTGKLQSGGAVPRAFIVGRAMTAGSLVYANTYSGNAGIAAAAALSMTIDHSRNNAPNAYLVQVIALADIPVSALVSLFVGSAAAAYDSGATASFEGIPIPEYNKDGRDHLWVRFYNGTQVAADPQLVELFGTDSDRPYTSARIGTGVAYVVVTTLINQDLFPGFPQLKFVLDGSKLYDRRYDTSVGGSGSQRWATPSTWALTSNPIVIAENILRGISYGGSWVYGAQTVTETQLPFASWTAAASECDSAITLAAGGTEPQFQAGGEVRFDVEPAATLEELFKACNGRLAEIGGTYKVRAGAAGSAVFSFTDGDILSTEQQTFEPFPSLGQTINAVTAKYISPAEGWVPKDAPPLYDATLETADGGRRQPVDVSYGFVTSGSQVQRLMKAERDMHRAMRSHSLPMPPEAFVLEPLDVVSWTSIRNGYSSKLFKIVSAEDLPNFNMGLALKEIDTNAYDWTAETDEQPVTDGTIVIVRPPSQAIGDWAVEPWTILSDSIQGQPGIKISWDASAADVDGVLFQVRLASSSEVINSGTAEDFSAGEKIVGENLLFNTAYQVRGQYRPISVRDVTWSSWTNVTTPNIRMSIVALNDALNAHITTQLAEAMALLNETQSLIASLAAEQDAANWIDKKGTRTAITASVASAHAAVVSESAVRASEDDALAVDITTVEASVDDVSASGQFRTIASAGSDGATAAVDLQARATVGGIFATAGLQLAAFVDLALNAFSRVRLYGDSTEIGIPSVSGGDFVAPFAVQTVNEVPQVSLVPAMVPDNAIEARMMGVGATCIISTIDVANIDDTIDNWYNSGSGKAIIDQDFITDAGSAAILHFKTKLYVVSGSPGQNYTITVSVNGSTMETLLVGVLSSTDTRVNMLSIFIDSLPGGQSTVVVNVLPNNNTSGSNHVGAKDISVVVEEIRKPLVNALSALASPSIAYSAHANGGTSGSFSGVSIGSAVANRVVAVALGWTSQTTNTPTMTIGGAAANLASGTIRHLVDFHTAMFYLRVPSGTTADIVASIPGSDNDNIEIVVWKVVANNEAPFWNDGKVAPSGGSNALTKNGLLSGMVCVACSYGDGSISGFTGSWSGSDTLTEDVDAAAGDARVAGYSVALTEAGNFGVAYNNGSSSYLYIMSIAVWQ